MPKKNVNRIDKRQNEYKLISKTLSSVRHKQVREYVKNLKILTTKMDEAKNLPLNQENAKIFKELGTAYKNCLISTVEFSKNGREILGDYKMNHIEILRKALSKDMRALKSYEKKFTEGKIEKPLTFGQLLDDARASKYTVHASDIGKASAGQHVRAIIPLNNKKVYFTESKAGNSKEEDIFLLKQQFMKNYGKQADFLTSSNTDALIELAVMDHGFDMSMLSNANKTPAESLNKMRNWMSNMAETHKDKKKTSDELKNKMARAKYALNKEVVGTEKIKILQEYIKAEKKLQLGHDINENQAINPYSVQDKRNSAMSMVAGLLDMENVICHSENANITINDGIKSRVVKGTAMDEAKGLDIKSFNSKTPFVKMTKEPLQNVNLIKNIAELQVLDFICGNCDRHGANLLYNFDENGNLVGLQGIDNDSSFGANYKASGLRGTKVGPESMTIIPASVAKKILNLDASEFKIMLYGYDLSIPEAEKAAERLKSIQDTIRSSQEYYKGNDISEGILTSGMPRIVDDDKLMDYSFDKQLAIKHSTTDSKGKTTIEAGNLFGIISNNSDVSKNIDRARRNNLNVVNDLSSSMTETGAELNKLAGKMDDINGWYHFGSPQFNRMLNNCKSGSEYMRKFEWPLIKPIKEYDPKTKNNEKDYELTEEARKYRKFLEDSVKITDMYINERALKNKDVINQKKGSAGWKRYQFALEYKETLKKQLALIEKAEKAINDNKELTEKAPELIADAARKNAEFDQKTAKWQARNNDVVSFNNELERVRDKIEKDKNNNNLVDMLDGKLKLTALRGMRASEEEQNRGRDIKDDPKQYEIYKQGLAASLIRRKLELTDASLKNGSKGAAELDALKDIDITNAGNPDKCIEDVMKTERFAKLLENPPKFTMEDCKKQIGGNKEADRQLTDSVVNAFVGKQAKADIKKEASMKK